MHGPCDPSATQPPADASCGSLEKLSNVTRAHKKKRGTLNEAKIVGFVNWKWTNSDCTRCRSAWERTVDYIDDRER